MDQEERRQSPKATKDSAWEKRTKDQLVSFARDPEQSFPNSAALRALGENAGFVTFLSTKGRFRKMRGAELLIANLYSSL